MRTKVIPPFQPSALIRKAILVQTYSLAGISFPLSSLLWTTMVFTEAWTATHGKLWQKMLIYLLG